MSGRSVAIELRHRSVPALVKYTVLPAVIARAGHLAAMTLAIAIAGGILLIVCLGEEFRHTEMLEAPLYLPARLSPLLWAVELVRA